MRGGGYSLSTVLMPCNVAQHIPVTVTTTTTGSAAHTRRSLNVTTCVPLARRAHSASSMMRCGAARGTPHAASPKPRPCAPPIDSTTVTTSSPVAIATT